MLTLYINTLIISILWAIGPIAQKLLLVDFSASIILIFSSVFYTLCAILYGIYNRNELKKSFRIIKYKHILLLFVSGVLSGFLANRLYFLTLKNNSSAIVTGLTAGFPLITVFLAYYILSEKISLVSIFGILLVCIGVILIGYGEKRYNLDTFTKND